MTVHELSCVDERRRGEVRRQERNGLDYLEVSDDQLRLTVYFLAPAPEDLTTHNIRITGGRRVRDVRVTGAFERRIGNARQDAVVIRRRLLVLSVRMPSGFSANHS